MSGLTDESLPGYATIHCRTERALFHAGHLRQLLTLADLPIPEWLQESDGFYAAHADQIDPIVEIIEKKRAAERAAAATKRNHE